MTQTTPDEPSDASSLDTGSLATGPTDGGTTDSRPAASVSTGAGGGHANGQQSAAIWPQKRLQVGRGKRGLDAGVAVLTRWGLVPHTYVMTTIGRKTGQPRSTPVTLVEKGDKRWLVAPYGPVSWVLNARAAGRVSIKRRGRSLDYAIEEISVDQAGPILKDYLKIAGATKTYFQATNASPVAEFTAEASRHPVFELTLINGPRG